MKKSFGFPAFFLLISLVAVSCHSSYRTTAASYSDYRITTTAQKDPSLLNIIQPYSDSVNKSMNDIVGIAGKNLDTLQPECTLGNFMVDAFFIMAKEKYKTPIDIAFMNFGGIRLAQLPAGNVTRGKIFELMPFDNIIVLQKMKGDQLQQFLDFTAAVGGWPVAGMTMQIKNKKAINVSIAGKPIDMNAMYVVANSDFVANGGDRADMLRNIPRQSTTIPYLMRDALFDYINKLKSEGKNISANIENSVTYAE